MKIYRAWCMTAGRWDTTIGYFENKKDAERSLPTSSGAADPEVGVEEIDVILSEECGYKRPTSDEVALIDAASKGVR